VLIIYFLNPKYKHEKIETFKESAHLNVTTWAIKSKSFSFIGPFGYVSVIHIHGCIAIFCFILRSHIHWPITNVFGALGTPQ
jgi:hypothetical protein